MKKIEEINLASEIEKLKQRVHYLEGECQKLAAMISQLVAEKNAAPKEVHHHYHYPQGPFPHIVGPTPQVQWYSPKFLSTIPNQQAGVQC